MKSSLIDLFKRARKPRDIKFRNQLYVFLVCLAISIFVWFLISLSQVYVSSVKYHLVYTNIPENRIISNEGAGELSLRIRTRGFNLFSLKYLTVRNPIRVDLSAFYVSRDKETGLHYFLSGQIRQQVINQLGATDQLLSISPDTVFFNLDKVIELEVPVKADLDLQFRKQFQLYDSIKTNPSSVTIRGPESLIDSIMHISTIRKTLNDINQNTSFLLDLDKPFKDKLVSYSTEKVEVNLFVEEFTEAIVERGLIIQGFDPGMRIKTFPEMVAIKYTVALKDYQRVDPAMFNVYAAPDSSLDRPIPKIHITRTECPPFVRITSVTPSELDYIILE